MAAELKGPDWQATSPDEDSSAWRSFVNKHGHRYFIHEKTREVAWQIPLAESVDRGIIIQESSPAIDAASEMKQSAVTVSGLRGGAASSPTAASAARPAHDRQSQPAEQKSPPHPSVASPISPAATGPTPPPSSDEPLPKLGWEVYVDQASGYPFYHHPDTGHNLWTLPPGIVTPQLPQPSNPARRERFDLSLPSGWHAYFDDAGNTYFENQFTGESTWERPTGLSQPSGVTSNVSTGDQHHQSGSDSEYSSSDSESSGSGDGGNNARSEDIEASRTPRRSRRKERSDSLLDTLTSTLSSAGRRASGVASDAVSYVIPRTKELGRSIAATGTQLAASAIAYFGTDGDSLTNSGGKVLEDMRRFATAVADNPESSVDRLAERTASAGESLMGQLLGIGSDDDEHDRSRDALDFESGSSPPQQPEDAQPKPLAYSGQIDVSAVQHSPPVAFSVVAGDAGSGHAVSPEDHLHLSPLERRSLLRSSQARQMGITTDYGAPPKSQILHLSAAEEDVIAQMSAHSRDVQSQKADSALDMLAEQLRFGSHPQSQ